MRRLAVLLFFFGVLAEAQQVLPLYQNNSLKTFVTMPFRLQRTTNEGIPIVNLAMVGGAGECRVMIDPKIPQNFLLKCESPSMVTVDVYFENAGVMQKIRYGPLNVTAISASGVVQPPPPEEDDFQEGYQLFRTNCIGCHSPDDKKGADKTAIQRGIQQISRMQHLKSLSGAELDAIAAFLNSL